MVKVILVLHVKAMKKMEQVVVEVEVQVDQVLLPQAVVEVVGV